MNILPYITIYTLTEYDKSPVFLRLTNVSEENNKKFEYRGMYHGSDMRLGNTVVGIHKQLEGTEEQVNIPPLFLRYIDFKDLTVQIYYYYMDSNKPHHIHLIRPRITITSDELRKAVRGVVSKQVNDIRVSILMRTLNRFEDSPLELSNVTIELDC